MAKTTHSDDADGIRVLVCGSGRFTEKGFVFGLLNGFAATFDISTVISGPFSGADEIAKEWAKERGVAYEPLAIGDADRMTLPFFDESREIPELILRNDPMFRKGFERVRDSAASVLLIIPTPEGRLGPTSACLKRMAGAVNIPCIDGAEALAAISQRMASAATPAPAAPAQGSASTRGKPSV